MDKIKRYNAVESRMIQAIGGIAQWCTDADVTALESKLEEAIKLLEEVLEDTLAPDIDNFLNSIK